MNNSSILNSYTVLLSCIFLFLRPITLLQAQGGGIWLTPLNVSGIVHSEDARFPQAVVDCQGNPIAIWQQVDGSVTRIYVSQFDGTSWASSTTVSGTTHTENAAYSQIAIDCQDNAIAIWQQSVSSITRIYVSQFNGTSWTSPTAVSGIVHTGNAAFPQIKIDCQDNAIAVWEQVTTGTTRIYVSHFNGTSWTSPTIVSGTDHPGDAGDPQIVVDCQGNAIAVWEQDDSGTTRIYASRFDGASWASSTTASGTAHTEDAENPQVTVDCQGNVIAVWEQVTTGTTRIYSSRFDGASWASPTTVSGTVHTEDAENPQIMADCQGDAIAVWEQGDGSGVSRIYASLFDGVSWTSSATVSGTDHIGNAGNPQITADCQGNAIAVWEQVTTGTTRIYASHFEGMSWTLPTTISGTGHTGNAVFPQITIDCQGNATVVWEQYVSGAERIYSVQFDAVTVPRNVQVYQEVSKLPKDCFYLTVGGGCKEDGCQDNIFVFKGKNELEPITNTGFDDAITALEWIRVGDCEYLLAGSEMYNWSYTSTTPSKNEIVLYQASFCSPQNNFPGPLCPQNRSRKR